jgi:hypothetical protein
VSASGIPMIVYLVFLLLFLPFSFMFLQGSSEGGTCRVARNVLPKRRDAKESREGICFTSGFFWTIVSLPLLSEKVASCKIPTIKQILNAGNEA